jgi:hypothetical protein
MAKVGKRERGEKLNEEKGEKKKTEKERKS